MSLPIKYVGVWNGGIVKDGEKQRQKFESLVHLHLNMQERSFYICYTDQVVDITPVVGAVLSIDFSLVGESNVVATSTLVADFGSSEPVSGLSVVVPTDGLAEALFILLLV